MKQTFSNKWKSSTQTRKQRKYRYNAPLHIQSKFMGLHLSKELRKRYGTRSFVIRKGDEVKVLRGSFRGKTGKIGNVDIKKGRVTIDGLQNKKKDGTKINVYFNASNLIAISLNTDDKMRFKRSKVKPEVKKKESTGNDTTPNKGKVVSSDSSVNKKEEPKSENKQDAPEKTSDK
jgi:large subunit ribosomal protein L24